MKVALVICNDMHMDIANANTIVNHLMATGYEVVCDYTIADTVIILTCAFGPHKMYSVDVIADVRINAKPSAKIIVTGCLEKLCHSDLEAIPGIDVIPLNEVFVTLAKPTTVKQYIPQNKVIISTGCLHKCSYCVDPKIVGMYKSRPMEDILDEIEAMHANESTIYITGAQETADYGVDLYGKRNFAELMRKIVTRFPDCNYVIGWFHPAGLTEEVMTLILENENIVEIMLHIQHVSKKILKDMNRPAFDIVDEKIRILKTVRPDLVISTEVITGFPGETSLQFQELVKYLKKGYFDDIGVASYEPVEGTLAAELPKQIPAKTKKRRMECIMQEFSATCYPAPDGEPKSVFDEFFTVNHALKQMPKNIFKAEARQKYAYIAGTDTEEKLEFERVFRSVMLQIIEARSDFDFERVKKNLSVYTDEAKTKFYEIMEKGDFKEQQKNKARSLLLNNA